MILFTALFTAFVTVLAVLSSKVMTSSSSSLSSAAFSTGFCSVDASRVAASVFPSGFCVSGVFCSSSAGSGSSFFWASPLFTFSGQTMSSVPVFSAGSPGSASTTGFCFSASSAVSLSAGPSDLFSVCLSELLPPLMTTSVSSFTPMSSLFAALPTRTNVSPSSVTVTVILPSSI